MQEIWDLINKMSPYLLLGFGVAGLLHTFVPSGLYRRYIGQNSFRSVVWAALIGVPLPLCSCGVIPTAVSLRKEGASKGAATSFLIATPQTGVDSILATASLLGLPFAILRPVAALVTALFGGQLVTLATRNEPAEPISRRGEQTTQLAFRQKLTDALRYGYLDMIQDIGLWLVVGLIVAGLITVLVPDGFFLRYAETPVVNMAAMLAVSVPMYVCATGSIPIAVALMLKGLTPGAALVLLMAGPASNMASIFVIRKVLGRKTLWLYLLSITVGAVAFGCGIDYLLPREWFTSHLVQSHDCCNSGSAVFSTICSIAMCGSLVFALINRFLPKKHNIAMDKRVFKVDGMMCNHCRANVEKTLQSLQGIDNVEVDLATGTATVTGSATDEAIVSAITAVGYKATRI
jgi:uncharacterized membrane protein YraQ (UPF0718 family)/copper chaperone CopZ